MEKLNCFTIGYSADGNTEIQFFKPEGNALIQTTQNNAFYKGAVKDNKIEFLFNDEKGSHQKAIQCQDKILEPFCDIVASAVDANNVENSEKGEFSINNGEFKLIKRLKICLSKK